MTRQKVFICALVVLGLLVANGVLLYGRYRPVSAPAAMVHPAQPLPTTTALLLVAPTPTVGTPTATPSIITVNSTTTVTVTVQITDPTLLPGGVNFLRINSSGSSTILGVMHDDGANGDAVAGDKIFTLQVPFNEMTAGQVQLQVSAAFKGQLKRTLSSVIQIAIWNQYTIPSTRVFLGVPSIGGVSASVVNSSSSIEFTFPNPSGSDPIPTVLVTAVSLDGSQDLETWFLSQNAANQELLDWSTYTLQTRQDGSQVLQNTGATPDDYAGPPPIPAYMLSPDKLTLLIIEYNFPESPLNQLGITNSSIDQTIDAFISNISFR